MTYTFKLARRLAVSRTFSMLPAILLFVACSGGDATAPGSDPLGPQEDWRSRKAVTVSVNPSRVTVETNQLIRFLARGRNSAGDSVYAPITWRATGGTILPDGRFSSDSAGTFMVTGRTRVTGATREREAVRLGTSTVVVVRSHPHLQTIEIAPGSATLAPGVTQSFVATGRLKTGRSVPVGVVWHATGGTIDAGGNYVAGDTAGTYLVTATHTTVTIADTAIVTITAPPPPPPPPATSPPADTTTPPTPPADTTAPPTPPADTTTPPTPTLAQVTLLPASATLAPSATRSFTAYGRTTAGDSVAVSVVFAATGGTVTAAGLYTAGSSAGSFRVIASVDGLADTSSVTITTPPAPTLAQVTLLPASATLAPSATRQFTAYGRTTAGDSVAVSVVFAATGGTVTAAGLYTAGSSAGSFRVIASVNGLADTSSVTITVPLGSGASSGIPFGPFALWNSYTTVKWGPSPFTMSQNYTDANGIVTMIGSARAVKQKLVLAMTGGAHSAYLTNGVFDRAKWNAKMQTFNTAAIKTAVAAGVADGTIIGNSIMDEPEHSSWGPPGWITKPLLSQMAASVKAIFPTLPVGVNHGAGEYYLWRPTERYTTVDYVANNYVWRVNSGNITDYRNKVLAQAALDGVKVLFSLNILDGGTKIAGCFSGPACCPIPETGGIGTFAGAGGQNCRMTAAQVRDWGLAIGPAGCALLMWQYDGAFMSKTDNVQAFKDVAAHLATLPAKSCSKS